MNAPVREPRFPQCLAAPNGESLADRSRARRAGLRIWEVDSDAVLIALAAVDCANLNRAFRAVAEDEGELSDDGLIATLVSCSSRPCALAAKVEELLDARTERIGEVVRACPLFALASWYARNCPASDENTGTVLAVSWALATDPRWVVRDFGARVRRDLKVRALKLLAEQTGHPVAA